MLIDTHAHLNFNAYKKDVDEVIKRSLDNEIWLINIGSNYITSKRAIEIAEKYSGGGLCCRRSPPHSFKYRISENKIR